MSWFLILCFGRIFVTKCVSLLCMCFLCFFFDSFICLCILAVLVTYLFFNERKGMELDE